MIDDDELNKHLSYSHYIREDEISDFQKRAIAELRLKVKDDLVFYPDYNTDFSLLRWLMGFQFDIDVIIPKLKATLQIFRAFNLHNMDFETAEEVNNYIKKLTVAAPYYPGGLIGYDKEGNIINLQPIAKSVPKLLIKTERVSSLFLLSILESELTFKLIRKQEKIQKRKLGVKIVVDLSGFSSDLLFMPCIKVYMNVLSTLQELFPDFARVLYIINCPKIMNTVWVIVKPALSKQTREKVKFLTSDWREVLKADLGEKYLYPDWVGSKINLPEKLAINLRPGGIPPKELYFTEDRLNNTFNLNDLIKISIPARSKKSVFIEAKKEQQIHWYFLCSGNDIDFSVELNSKICHPRYRITTEFVPEYNFIIAHDDGNFELIFDNTYGKIFAKSVQYVIKIV
uniref:CRAL-TRIO domain-containing protein n=1 Tax=Rhabditophanes sp. KR3021 TaxID=114890 RepID=A0AC35U5X3_9BILA